MNTTKDKKRKININKDRLFRGIFIASWSLLFPVGYAFLWFVHWLVIKYGVISIPCLVSFVIFMAGIIYAMTAFYVYQRRILNI